MATKREVAEYRRTLFKDVPLETVCVYEAATGILLPTDRGKWVGSLEKEFQTIEELRTTYPLDTIGELAIWYLKLRIKVIERRHRRAVIAEAV